MTSAINFFKNIAFFELQINLKYMQDRLDATKSAFL